MDDSIEFECLCSCCFVGGVDSDFSLLSHRFQSLVKDVFFDVKKAPLHVKVSVELVDQRRCGWQVEVEDLIFAHAG